MQNTSESSIDFVLRHFAGKCNLILPGFRLNDGEILECNEISTLDKSTVPGSTCGVFVVHLGESRVSDVNTRRGEIVAGGAGATFISKRVFKNSFCTSQFPHKFVNTSFIITNREQLTELCGNTLLQNDFKNTWCEKNLVEARLEGGGRPPEASNVFPHREVRRLPRSEDFISHNVLVK